MRYSIPDVPEHPRTPMPATRYLYVGDFWRDGAQLFDGLRDPILEMVNSGEKVGGCMGNRTLKSGKTVLDVETEDTFDVDLEGAYMALDYERDRMMEMHRSASDTRRLTAGYRWWARLGVISLSPQQVSMHDEILKRSAFKERMDIAGPNVDLDYLISLTEQSNKDPSINPPEKKDDPKKADEPKIEAAKQYAQVDLFAELDEEEADNSPAMA